MNIMSRRRKNFHRVKIIEDFSDHFDSKFKRDGNEWVIQHSAMMRDKGIPEVRTG